MINRPTSATRVVRLAPLVAFVAVSGCFATRNDVRVVQADLATVRTEMAKQAADQREALAQAMRVLQTSNDSIRVMSNRLTATQGDVRGGLRNVSEQLIRVQELLKQTDDKIRQARAEQQDLLNRPAVVPPTTAPLTSADSLAASAAANAAVTPEVGAYSLYSQANSNLLRSSYLTARLLFQEILTRFPTSDLAPQAQLGIGRTFDGEKQADAAMAAYAAVVQKFPQSPAAATALYKHARILIDKARPNEAKPLLVQLTTNFKNADEYDAAVDLLKTLR